MFGKAAEEFVTSTLKNSRLARDVYIIDVGNRFISPALLFSIGAMSAFNFRTVTYTSSTTSVALGPTDFNEREKTHFGCCRVFFA